MGFQNIIHPQELEQLIGKEKLVLLDCRRNRKANHIVGAQMVDFEKDLTGKIIPGITGRHPLPRIDSFVELCSKWGIDADQQVVVYDENSGAWASRLWWMLKWLGHDNVAVLNGGWDHWKNAGKETTLGFIYPQKRKFIPRERRELKASIHEVEQIANGDTSKLLIDARAAERYRGENEPIDPIAGHIPSAVNIPFADNLDDKGLWRTKAEISERWSPAMTKDANLDSICYCGSGITACHNILAADYAGLGMPRLYPGSWSEWITKM